MISIDDIDNILPQTQCRQCGYPGCRPYADAIVNDNAAINLCPPGGKQGLMALGKLTSQDVTKQLVNMIDKPLTRAFIRENECIGCTKCLDACPVDAIVGASKYMHTVIANECTGCELCVAPCPVDCIDIIQIPQTALTQEQKITAKQRFNARNARNAFARDQEKKLYQHAKQGYQDNPDEVARLQAKKAVIQDIINRTKR